MTTKRAAAAVEVVAGFLPGQPDPEWTKQWFLTSDEWAAPDGRARLAELRRKAQEYADSLPLPDLFNWVRIDVVWF